MRPTSFSQGDITEFYVKVKKEVTDFLEILRCDDYMKPAYENLKPILPWIKILLTKGILFDCLPAKHCDNAQNAYVRPDSPGLLPTNLAQTCGVVSGAETPIPAIVAHTGNVTFSMTPTPRRDLSPSPRHARRESRSPDRRDSRPEHRRPARNPSRSTSRPPYGHSARSPARFPAHPPP